MRAGVQRCTTKKATKVLALARVISGVLSYDCICKTQEAENVRRGRWRNVGGMDEIRWCY